MRLRPHAWAVLGLVFAAPLLAADGLSPQDAARRMKVPPGFTVTAVAHEPMIRQPLSVSFDERGRMWVLQYLQYPNPAGLKALKQDQYLRTVWDKVPEPPPHGPKGLDRITICFDPDENGVFRKSKDFVAGLNMTGGFCIGNGGVYVVQPPYLLFYPDANRDDVPDRDPDVLLSGFGMEDTHSLANSLQFGPDGWLYGAAGSTSTCKIKNPADPKAEPIEFQQGIWRYHPKTKRFELFSEGGGNTYGLDFDRHGQAIAGTNYGGKAMLHQMQGAYHVKGFAKHGPLHNAHTYGYFDHVPYTGFKGGHVTCGGIVYQADQFPPEYRDQYIAGNLLSNAVYWHKMEPVGSTFKASHGGDLMETGDTWFRPVDLFQGPDGSVYVADWTDRRAAHLDPVDNWDKTNGRIFRVSYKGAKQPEPFDLAKKSSAELVELLKHPNKWWRNEARRLLGERGDTSVLPALKAAVAAEKGEGALESLWALNLLGGFDEAFAREKLLTHPSEHVRAWAVRLAGDGSVGGATVAAWTDLAEKERSPAVLAQLACSAKRLSPAAAVEVAGRLVNNPVAAADPYLPNLVWWAVEGAITRMPEVALAFAGSPANGHPLYRQTVEKTARRLMAVTAADAGYAFVSRLLHEWAGNPKPVLNGMAQALQGGRLDAVPSYLREPLAKLRAANPGDDQLLEILARMSDPAAAGQLRGRVADAKLPDAARLKAVDLLKQVRDPAARPLLLEQLAAAKSDAFRVGLLAALEAYDDPGVGDAVLKQYAGFSPAVKKRALTLLLTRPAWALALLKAVDAGSFPKADVTLDHAKAAVGLNDAAVTAVVEKHWGKLGAQTAGEKVARITWLNRELSHGGPGDLAKGKALFTKHCAACHQMFGEGGKVGPDLTTADRKNRGYMLAQIVDPSGYIRPEYVVHVVTTADGRKLSGVVAASSAESVTLVNVVNNQPQQVVVAKGDIEDMKPSALSLMPEKLLDTLSYAEVVDLFAFLASDAKGGPAAPPAAPPKPAPAAAKKLKVCLVSGAFEYKSDASLEAFKKHLEGHYPVECSTAVAKSEKEISGLENLDGCDVAVFFTRRLKVPDAELERVKKYVASKKPVVGVRTASHGFQGWLEMDTLVFGGDYKNHFGHNIKADVKPVPAAKSHPVLAGVEPFSTAGGLYKNPNIAKDVTVLLRGTTAQADEPVAWVREAGGRRVFYTSLGTPDDFANPNFVRLLTNGLAWAATTPLEPAK